MRTISVAIVTFNPDAALLDECINSICEAATETAAQWEILIGDNGSTDLQFIDRLPSGTRAFLFNENLGFGRAANRLARLATGDIILFLNPDACLDKGAGQELLDLMCNSAEQSVIYTGRLHKNGLIQTDAYWHWWTTVEHSMRRGCWTRYLNATTNNPSVIVPKVCGGALFGQRSELISFGPFDEDFFLYGEDADLSLRAKAAGTSLRLANRVSVSHQAASSMVTHSALVERARTDAAIRLASKHLPYFASFAVRLDLALTTAVGMITGARSSTSRRVRGARFEELSRWGLKAQAGRFDPSNSRSRAG